MSAINFLEFELCVDCVGDGTLKSFIEKSHDEGVCTFCERDIQTVWLHEITEFLGNAISVRFAVVRSEDGYEESELDDQEFWLSEAPTVGDSVYSLLEIVSRFCKTKEGVSEAIAQAICEDENCEITNLLNGEDIRFRIDDEYYLLRSGKHSYFDRWAQLEGSLKYRSRYLNREVKEILDEIFGRLSRVYHPQQMSLFPGSDNLLIEIGPGTEVDRLYRARDFDSSESLMNALKKKDHGIGPPPAHLASAGRMNATGISAFYSASDEATAIAEIRPAVGSLMAVAIFEILESLTVLDLHTIGDAEPPGSCFDNEYWEGIELLDFLKVFRKNISKPVLPGNEGLSYLASQVVAEYFANYFKPELHGICFPSVQHSGGRNYVLFPSKVAIRSSLRKPAADIPERPKSDLESLDGLTMNEIAAKFGRGMRRRMDDYYAELFEAEQELGEWEHAALVLKDLYLSRVQGAVFSIGYDVEIYHLMSLFDDLLGDDER